MLKGGEESIAQSFSGITMLRDPWLYQWCQIITKMRVNFARSTVQNHKFGLITT